MFKITNISLALLCHGKPINNNNNNNNNRVYTPLSERCSQSRVFTTYQIQISEKNTCRHSHTDRVTNVHN